MALPQLSGRSVTVTGLDPLTVTDDATGATVPDVLPVGIVPANGDSGLLVVVDGRPWLWPAASGQSGLTAAMLERLEALREAVADEARNTAAETAKDAQAVTNQMVDVTQAATAAVLATGGVNGVLTSPSADPLPTTRKNGTDLESGDLLYLLDADGNWEGARIWDGSAWIFYGLAAQFIMADTFRGRVIAGADLISNETGDPNNYARMHDQSFTVGRDDGEGGSLVTTQLGGAAGDQLILRDSTGQTRAMLDATTGTGSVSGQFSVGSLRHNGDLLTDLLARLPQPMPAFIQGHGDSPTAGSSAIVHMRLNANTSTDRMYRLSVDGIMAATTAGDRVQVIFRTFEPTTKDLHLGNFVIPTTTGEHVSMSFVFPGLVDGAARFALMFRNATANRAVFWSGRTNYPVQFYLEDLGARRFVPGEFDLMGTTPLGTGTNTDSTGPVEYVKEYPATWTRSWRGGSIVTDFLHHGQWGGIQRYSMVGFDNAQLTSDLSGATLIKAEVLLDNQHWYYGAGGTLRIGSATNTSAPSSPVTSGTVATTPQGYSEQKWAAVGGFTTSSRAITLGVGAGSSLEYYGKQSTSGVRLRLTIRK